MDLFTLLSQPPSMPSAVMTRKCPYCKSKIEPYHINLEEVAFMCTQCMYPFEEPDIGMFLLPKAALSFFDDFKLKKKRTSIENDGASKKQKTSHMTPEKTSSKSSVEQKPNESIMNADFSPAKQRGKLNDRPQHSVNTSSEKPIHKAGPPITASFVSTLEKLKAGGWFTDEVVNAYFALLGKRYPRTGFMSSYFAVSENAKNWSTTQSIVEDFRCGKLDQIVFPYHIPGHWTLIVVRREGFFYLLDSLGQLLPEPIEIRKWLHSEFTDRTWKFDLPFHFPLQQDSIHCGAFICLFAELASQGKSFQAIAQSALSLNIQQYRVSLLEELLNQAVGKVENLPIVISDTPKPKRAPNTIALYEENGKSEASSPDMQPEMIDLSVSHSPKSLRYNISLGGLEPSYGIFGTLNQIFTK